MSDPRKSFEQALLSERVAVRFAGEFTPDGWKKHKKEHPGADLADHTITKGDKPAGNSKDGKPVVKYKNHPEFSDRNSPYYINRLNKHLKDLGDPTDWDAKKIYKLRDKLVDKTEGKDPDDKKVKGDGGSGAHAD